MRTVAPRPDGGAASTVSDSCMHWYIAWQADGIWAFPPSALCSSPETTINSRSSAASASVSRRKTSVRKSEVLGTSPSSLDHFFRIRKALARPYHFGGSFMAALVGWRAPIGPGSTAGLVALLPRRRAPPASRTMACLNALAFGSA